MFRNRSKNRKKNKKRRRKERILRHSSDGSNPTKIRLRTIESTSRI